MSSVVDDNILRWTSLGTMTRFGGTIRWEAPELMEDPEDEAAGSPRPTFQSDVYSVASVMYEVYASYQLPDVHQLILAHDRS